MSGFASKRSQISGSRDSSSTFSSTSRPTRTSETPSNPSAGSARSTVWPWGSRIPSFGRIRMRFFNDTNDPKGPGAKEEGPGKCCARPGPDDAGSRSFAGALEPCGKGFTRDALVGLEVQGASSLDHVVRQRRRGRRLVPPRACGPVAHVLLVERWLTVPRLVAIGRPETGGVGREHLVAQDDLAVLAAPKLELRVGQDDPAAARMLGGE